jgi:L-ascorbate metabolism protein UlaG (beta-lactamase superfamily)
MVAVLAGLACSAQLAAAFLDGHRQDPTQLAAVMSVPSAGEDLERPATGVKAQSGPLTVWYLGHCGFAVKAGDKVLVFDYVSNLGTPSADPAAGGFDDGTIEAPDLEGLETFVFASHAHRDHFDRAIMDWAGGGEGVHYFFGWEAGDVAEHHYMVGPNASAEVSGVKVYTVNSVPDGIPEVAYLVEVDGMWIYHNGDHFVRNDEDLDYLAGISSEIDLAFVPGFAAPGAPFFEKGMRFLERFKPRIVFPMHRGGDEEAAQEWAQVLADRGMVLDLRFPQARGDRFDLEG